MEAEAQQKREYARHYQSEKPCRFVIYLSSSFQSRYFLKAGFTVHMIMCDNFHGRRIKIKNILIILLGYKNYLWPYETIFMGRFKNSRWSLASTLWEPCQSTNISKK